MKALIHLESGQPREVEAAPFTASIGGRFYDLHLNESLLHGKSYLSVTHTYSGKVIAHFSRASSRLDNKENIAVAKTAIAIKVSQFGAARVCEVLDAALPLKLAALQTP